MLHGIGTGPRTPDVGGVVPRLMDCHERIRRHVAIALRLGGAAPAPADQIAAAAHQCVRYFGEALPLHSADEDDSIAPCLPLGLRAELATVAAQHVAIHELLHRLLPLWREIAGSPDQRVARSAELTGLATQLEAHFAEHLALEESVIFPTIERLDDDRQAAIVAEMVARRAPP